MCSTLVKQIWNRSQLKSLFTPSVLRYSQLSTEALEKAYDEAKRYCEGIHLSRLANIMLGDT